MLGAVEIGGLPCWRWSVFWRAGAIGSGWYGGSADRSWATIKPRSTGRS